MSLEIPRLNYPVLFLIYNNDQPVASNAILTSLLLLSIMIRSRWNLKLNLEMQKTKLDECK